MSYALEAQEEYLRLERQAQQPQYSISEELRFLKVAKSPHILDAGCGSGAVTRVLLSKEPTAKITSVDMSEIRLKQAEKLNSPAQNARVEFKASTLDKLPLADNSVDAVVCRFVYEYLPDAIKVTEEFKRVLKPGGVCYLIDVDGLHLNTWTNNPKLNSMLAKMHAGLKVDMNAGRKLKSHLAACKFKGIETQIDVVQFSTPEDIKLEKENNEKRFLFAREKLIEAFGSETRTNEFIRLYLEEMSQPGSTIFFNKFITWARK